MRKEAVIEGILVWLARLLIWALPATAPAATLEEALALAFATNPQLAAERAQLHAVDEAVPQALAGWRPTVTLSGGAGLLHQTERLACNPPDCIGGSIDSNQNLQPRNGALTLNQSLYQGGQTVAQTRRAEALVLSEQANLVLVENNVFIAVIADYLGLILAQRTVDLNRSYVGRLARQVGLTSGRQRAGELTRTDILLAETYHLQALAGLRGAEANLDIALASYERDVGEAAGEVSAPAAPQILPDGLDRAIALAEEKAPALIQGRYALTAAENNLRAIEAQLLPSLSLQAAYGRDRDESQRGLATMAEQIELLLTIPLYEGGAVYAQARAAKDQVAQQLALNEENRKSIDQAVRQAWISILAARATIHDIDAQIKTAEGALEKTEEEAMLGGRGVFDILNLEQILFQARGNLLQAEHDERYYQFALLQQLGLLTAVDLGLSVAADDVAGDLQRARAKWFGLN